MQFASHLQARDARVARASLIGAVGLMLCASSAMSPRAWAQQVMWKDNPITGKVVGLTYGTSSWTAAEAQAVVYGGHLATIRNQAEQGWLVQQFAAVWDTQYPGAPGFGPWIGWNRLGGSWTWASGAPVSFVNWAPNEPNGSASDVYGHLRTLSWGWNDAPNGPETYKALIEVGQRPPRSWSWREIYQSGANCLFGDAADFDGDGDLDYASPDNGAQPPSVSVWRNDGNGTFAAYQAPLLAAVTLVRATDWDQDGDVDLLMSTQTGVFMAENVFGSFAPAVPIVTGFPAYGMEVADLNHDGVTDLVTAAGGAGVRIFLRSASGQVPSSASQAPLANDVGELTQPTVADLDGDGHVDIAAGGSVVALLRGSSSGFFTDVGRLNPGGRSWVTLALDVDSDGQSELIVPNVDAFSVSAIRVYQLGNQLPLSAANYSLHPVTPTIGGSGLAHWIESADVDGDSTKEIIACYYDSSSFVVYRKSGTQYLRDHVFDGIPYSLYTRTVDFTGDGRPDILAASPTSSRLFLFRNQSFFDCNGNGIDDPLDLSSGTATDCNSNGRPDTCDLAFGLSQDSDGDGLLNECEPTLVSVTPSTLPAFLGGTVTVRGTNIPDGVVRLDLGGTPLPFTMTDNVGTVTIPPLTAARSSDLTTAATLAFLGPNGPEVTGALAAAFTWDVPEITAATPGSAPYDQATGVAFTLEDSTLLTATGMAIFGSAAPQAAYLITVNGHSKVITTAPPQAAPGPVSVLLRLGNEQALAERGFVYLGPGITATSVSNGWQAGGEPLTLELVDFVPNVPVEVRLGTGTTTGTPSGLLAASTLVVTTPYTAAPGVVDLELVQNAGQPNEKRVLSPGAWLADAPLVVGATPANAYQGGGDAVSVNVAGFVPGIAARVQIGSSALGYASVDATVVGTLDAAAIAFTMPLAPFAGLCDLVVTQAAGTPNELRATSAGAFTVVGASIASLSPTSGPLEGGTTVVVQTSGFQEGVPAQVTLGGTTVAGLVAGSGANQTVTFRTTLAAASGPTAVDITQGVFNAALPAGYSFDAPRVVRFCAAKITGQGTLPVIGWTGAPSATTGDFAITLSSALPNKTAQYFYGDSNNNFFPFFGGTLCVAVNVTRGPLSSTNASSAASVPFPVNASLIGRKRYFQWWFRDPLDPAGFGRGLSAGLEVEFYN